MVVDNSGTSITLSLSHRLIFLSPVLSFSSAAPKHIKQEIFHITFLLQKKFTIFRATHLSMIYRLNPVYFNFSITKDIVRYSAVTSIECALDK